MKPRWTGRIVPDPKLFKKSYKGAPQTREHDLEITYEECERIRRQLPGREMCFNHNKDLVIGTVLRSFFNDDHELCVEFELNTDNLSGELVEMFIERGACKALSLNSGMNGETGEHMRPIEVSVCRDPGRPGSDILERVPTPEPEVDETGEEEEQTVEKLELPEQPVEEDEDGDVEMETSDKLEEHHVTLAEALLEQNEQMRADTAVTDSQNKSDHAYHTSVAASARPVTANQITSMATPSTTAAPEQGSSMEVDQSNGLPTQSTTNNNVNNTPAPAEQQQQQQQTHTEEEEDGDVDMEQLMNKLAGSNMSLAEKRAFARMNAQRNAEMASLKRKAEEQEQRAKELEETAQIMREQVMGAKDTWAEMLDQIMPADDPARLERAKRALANDRFDQFMVETQASMKQLMAAKEKLEQRRSNQRRRTAPPQGYGASSAAAAAAQHSAAPTPEVQVQASSRGTGQAARNDPALRKLLAVWAMSESGNGERSVPASHQDSGADNTPAQQFKKNIGWITHIPGPNGMESVDNNPVFQAMLRNATCNKGPVDDKVTVDRIWRTSRPPSSVQVVRGMKYEVRASREPGPLQFIEKEQARNSVPINNMLADWN
jgi:hypothetical protein